MSITVCFACLITLLLAAIFNQSYENGRPSIFVFCPFSEKNWHKLRKVNIASSYSQIDKPQHGHTKRAELLDVNINTGAQSINTESLFKH